MSNFLLAIALCLPTGAAFAQTGGSITGEVKDPSGAVAPNAAVTVTNSATNVARSTVTNAAGNYSFPDLTPGIYQIKCGCGLCDYREDQHRASGSADARVDFSLTVGTANQMIEVTSSGGLLSTENRDVGTVIEQKRISELPLNGRNFFSLVALAPNVAFASCPHSRRAGVSEAPARRLRCRCPEPGQPGPITRSTASPTRTSISTLTFFCLRWKRCRNSRFSPESIPPSSAGKPGR